MPNYEVVSRFCSLRKIDARCPAIIDADSSAPENFGEFVNDCFSRDEKCEEADCKFAGGDKEPFK
ncbi:MAG: hypothetical protein PHT59_01545 [Candidatus Omnitrophica bacterium]|nr:hypothetical protein [Candidatus Omnitrophota bacterium]